MVFVCDLHLKEANIHINLIYFDDNFDHPHVNVATFVSRNKTNDLILNLIPENMTQHSRIE